MRVLQVSVALLALGATFGLGVIVGRFVMNDTPGAGSMPSLGPVGADGLPGESTGLDQTIPNPFEAPPAPPRPLAPASDTPLTDASVANAAQLETEAAMAGAGCNGRVSKAVPVRSWTSRGQAIVEIRGASCDVASVRVAILASDGAPVLDSVINVSDLGLEPGASPDTIRRRLERILPDSAVRAQAYPAWPEGAAAPVADTEFSRDVYETVRASDGPVVCVTLPGSGPRCVATDPTTGRSGVMSDG